MRFRFREAAEHFQHYARLHGRSRKTLQLYAWVFQLLERRFGDPELELEELGPLELRRWLGDLLQAGWKPTSVAIVHRVLHAFFAWCVREGFLRGNPLEDVPAPKTAKLFPFTLDDSQIQALLKACDKRTPHGFRNYVILLLFLDCGLRLQELIDLRMGDVSLGQRALKVRGKGAKERVVYVGYRTAKALRRWLELRPAFHPLTDHVFVDRKGEPLKPRWVQEVIARLWGRRPASSSGSAPTG